MALGFASETTEELAKQTAPIKEKDTEVATMIEIATGRYGGGGVCLRVSGHKVANKRLT